MATLGIEDRFDGTTSATDSDDGVAAGYNREEDVDWPQFLEIEI